MVARMSVGCVFWVVVYWQTQVILDVTLVLQLSAFECFKVWHEEINSAIA